MSGYIDPKRAAVVAEVAGMGDTEAFDWLVDRVLELQAANEMSNKALDVISTGMEYVIAGLGSMGLVTARTQEQGR